MKGLTGQGNHFLFLIPYLIRFCVGVLGDKGLILISDSMFTPGPPQAGAIMKEE